MLIRGFIAYDFALIEGGAFENILEDAKDSARETRAEELEVNYPGDDPDGPKVQGTIWSAVVKSRIDAADKFIAFVDLPNANVGFEIGYACGMGKPAGIYRFKDSQHKWLKEPPLRGHMWHLAKDGEAIHKAFLKDELITLTRKPTGGDGVTVLCPPSGTVFSKQIDPVWGWKLPPLAAWNLDDSIPKQLEGTGLLVWIITPHGEGEEERDGTENACLSVLAGYAEAMPEIELRIFIHEQARAVADMEHCSKRFRANKELKGYLEELEVEWKGKVAARKNPQPAPVGLPALPTVGSSKPDRFPDHPEDLFRHDEALFIGREAELRIGAESAEGLMNRFRKTKGVAERGFRIIWAYGFGGMGKSWYLHRVRCRAEVEYPEVRSLIIDWDKPDWRSPLPGEPRVDSDLFDVIATRLCQKLGDDAADAYWRAKDRVVAFEKEHREQEGKFESQLQLACSEDSPRLESHFRQRLDAESLWDDELAKRVRKLDGMRKDPARYRELFGAWCKDTGLTEAAVICPARARAEGLRDSLRAALEKHPLILLVDTCEILSPDLDGWLRELVWPLLRDSLPLMVLVGSRLRPDLHQPTGTRRGWRLEIPEGQQTAFDFGEDRRFTVKDIDFAIVRLTRPFKGDSSALAAVLHRVTLGIPLALRTLLDMHNEGDDFLETLAEPEEEDRPLSKSEEVRKVIAVVTSRFLLNLTNHPGREDDLRDIVALGLLQRYDPVVLGVYWGQNHAARIRELAKRYSLLSDGDLHPSVRSFLRLDWRDEKQRPDVFNQVLSGLNDARKHMAGIQSPPSPEQRIALLASNLNLRSWSEDDQVVDELARALCLARVHELDGSLLEGLLVEIPLRGEGNFAARKLWHTDREEGVSDQEVVPWLVAQSSSSSRWTEEESAGLALLEGLVMANRFNDPHKAFAAFEAMEKATAYFEIQNLPRSTEAGMAFFDCGSALDIWVPKNVSWDRGTGERWAPAAAACYERAIQLGGWEATARNNLGNLYQDLGKPEKAEEEYLAAIMLDPKASSPHNGLGNLYQDLGKPEKAEEEYLAAIALDAKFAIPHNGLGNLYQDLGKPEKAEEEYLAAIALAPKYAAPHNGLGNLYQDHLGKPEKAEEEYLAAIALDPKYAYPHNGLGNLYRNHLGKPEKAEEEYLAAITLAPKYAAPHNGLGNLYRNHLGKPEKAEEEYLAAIALNPKYTLPHNSLGLLYEEQQKWDAAFKEFETEAELAPNRSGGKRGLAWVALLSSGDTVAGRRFADEIETLASKHPGTSLLSAAVDAWSGSWQGASEKFSFFVRDLRESRGYLAWSSRTRIGALLRKAREADQLDEFSKTLKTFSDRPWWKPWAEAVEAWVEGKDAMADPKASELLRLLRDDGNR